MKALALFLMMASMTSFATIANARDYSFICKEKKEANYGSLKTLTIKQLGSKQPKENEKFLVLVNLFETYGVSILKNEKMFAQQEDVHFSFGDSSKGISASIYLDELDTAYLYIDGKETLFDCR